MELISRLASKGLIHCDFNEFNLLINEQEEVGSINTSIICKGLQCSMIKQLMQ